jgi:dipeptidyl-peptidase-4
VRRAGAPYRFRAVVAYRSPTKENHVKALRTSTFVLIALGLLAAPLPAQGPSRLTLDRIFGSRDFFGDFFGPARWLEDGGYTTLEWTADRSGREIVRYEPATGERQVLVSAADLTPAGARQPLWIDDYRWSEDGQKLLIFTNTQRVWRSNTRGDYWVLDLESRRLRQLGADFDEAQLMFAKFAPDGDRAGYVYKNNVYVEDLTSGRITQLTDDGSEWIVNGTSDWVYEEEFFLRDGFRFSPNGRHIAYWQFDTQGVPWFTMINNTDSLYPTLIEFPYPKAGETNSAVRIGVVPADGGETAWVELEGDPRDNYIPRMEWADRSDQLVIQYLNRLQNTNWLTLAEAEDGKARTILTEKDEAWLDVVDDMQWLSGGTRFTWVSERDGWRHVYIVSRDGKKIEKVTPGEFDVVSVAHIDEAGGWLYYIASPENPTQRYLYRTPLDGSSASERLTPADQPGTHSYQIAPDASWAIHTYSRFATPSTIELIRLPSHEVVRTLVDNARLKATVAALEKGEHRFFRVDNGEGVMLDGFEMRPPDFDPSKKYPVLFYVYGEPWGQTARDAWMGSNYLWHLLLTQKGYIVVSVDNRGTPAPRGREWRKVVYKKIGVHASADQAAAVREIGSWPYVDPGRIAFWGWSGGGSMSLNMIFRYPELVSTAMAVAPVPDIRLYDTIYQERYMGLPQDNPQEYDQSSPITFAGNLQGNLLIVHGTGDDNVHYQGTERLINALVAAGRQFTVMPYPNRSHGIYEGRGTTLHVYTLLTDYLMEHVEAGGR